MCVYPDKYKDFCKYLGIHIKKLRDERNLTINELSLKTGIRVEYLKKLECGLAFGMRVSRHLLKLARVFDVSLSELLDCL